MKSHPLSQIVAKLSDVISKDVSAGKLVKVTVEFSGDPEDPSDYYYQMARYEPGSDLTRYDWESEKSELTNWDVTAVGNFHAELPCADQCFGSFAA